MGKLSEAGRIGTTMAPIGETNFPPYPVFQYETIPSGCPGSVINY